jgi:hypothetical protein
MIFYRKFTYEKNVLVSRVPYKNENLGKVWMNLGILKSLPSRNALQFNAECNGLEMHTYYTRGGFFTPNPVTKNICDQIA